MARRRITESLLIIEAVVIIGFLYWFSLESRANAFLRTWMLQNFPPGLVLLDERMVLAVTGGILGTILVWLSTFQRGGQRRVRRVAGGLRAWLPGLGVQKMVMLVISGIGVMLLGLGGVRGSISLVLAGMGLIFWGGLFFPRNQSSHSRGTDRTALASTNKMLTTLLSQFNLEREPIYAARGFESGEVRASLVVILDSPRGSTSSMSGEDPLSRVNFLPPPGEELLLSFEKRLGVDFSTVSPASLPGLLKRAVMEEFRLAEDFDYVSTGPIHRFRIFNCQYADVCREVSSTSHLASRIGCPFCSMVICALVKASARPASLESSVISAHGTVMEVTVRFLDDRERLQLMPILATGRN
ncbi:MAG TPA: hypothetical protein VIH83_06850 [Candidatus Bathyarchaeia archaeon]